jgi:cell division transport system permease protein
MRQTLERWLGPAGAEADLPLPALIEVDLAPGASSQAIAARVEQAVPGARFVAHSATLAPMLRAIRALTWLALALVLLIALATAAAVVLAARGALDTNRLFQRRIALDSLVGGVAGTVAAGLVLLLVAGGRAIWVEDLAGGPLLGAGDILVLAALPLLGTVLATLVARQAVLRALRASL